MYVYSKWHCIVIVCCYIVFLAHGILGEKRNAKLQNTGLLVTSQPLNQNSAYCVILRSSKDFDTCKTDGPKWPCIL